MTQESISVGDRVMVERSKSMRRYILMGIYHTVPRKARDFYDSFENFYVALTSCVFTVVKTRPDHSMSSGLRDCYLLETAEDTFPTILRGVRFWAWDMEMSLVEAPSKEQFYGCSIARL